MGKPNPKLGKPPKQDQPRRTKKADEKKQREAKKHEDEKLEEALKESFPASDPIAVTPGND